jgi:arylformamidase
MSKYIDVTIPISQDMAIFRGDPPVELDAVSSVKKGDPCNVTGICMGSHTGTHVDAPSHFFSSGKTVDEIPLDLFIGPARVFQMRGHKSISRDLLESLDMEGCSRVLFKTDHSYLLDRYTRFRPDYVHLSVDACGFLVQKGVRLVGIDSFSVE